MRRTSFAPDVATVHPSEPAAEWLERFLRAEADPHAMDINLS
jgi:hypothetical protein